MRVSNSNLFWLCVLVVVLSSFVLGQNKFDKVNNEAKLKKAKAVVEKAIEKLGGDNYRNVKNSVGEGRFSLLKGGQIVSFSSFVDVMVFPNKERTDFIEGGSKTVQVNVGDKGWFFDESIDKFADQNKIQLDNFKRSIRSHYNFLLRGDWKENAKLSYVGKRRASLGKRNYVLKLTFEDGFEVEYEFSAEGLPMKTIYTRRNAENLPIQEETRYAQFILENGVYSPFVVDHYTEGKHAFRVNYKSMEYNKRISNEIFEKPATTKKLTKKLKL